MTTGKLASSRDTKEPKQHGQQPQVMMEAAAFRGHLASKTAPAAAQTSGQRGEHWLSPASEHDAACSAGSGGLLAPTKCAIKTPSQARQTLELRRDQHTLLSACSSANQQPSAFANQITATDLRAAADKPFSQEPVAEGGSYRLLAGLVLS
ncbi:anionic trypsin-like [Platysternon megacephalum]|uniref:Anionic trypsin-like n=1 Tax=Platysternon megacephalum TaxID=55544 RepID=A0A4D9DL76_9SAUR|nr:anionic trypsin-like [Platysternon megacephalum]